MSTITMTNIDPGEGSSLESDNYLAVYGQTNLLDLFYPIGSFYQTADINFDPNESWGGVWEENTDYDLVAYLKADGTTIRASKNISSITRLSADAFEVQMSKQMANLDGVIEVTAEVNGLGQEIVTAFWMSNSVIRMDCANYSGTATEPLYWFLAVYGRLLAPEYRKWKRIA